MTTQHNALLMKMLFSGSMLIIIIVINVAWEPVSQDLYPDYREVVWNQLSLASLVPKLSQDVCCGKGSGGTLTTLRYFFNQFSAAS